MIFEEADKILERVIKFLIEDCGGVYKEVDIQELQVHILTSLACDQYIWRPGEAFMSWWYIDPEELEDVQSGFMPKTFHSGSMLFVTEHGRLDNKLRLDIKEIRRRSQGKQGLLFRHKGMDFKVFTKQRGVL